MNERSDIIEAKYYGLQKNQRYKLVKTKKQKIKKAK